MTLNYAGRSHDEAVAVRQKQRQKAQEQAGGEMAIEGAGADAELSCGELSERASRYGEVEARSTAGKGVMWPRRSEVMRAEQFSSPTSLTNRDAGIG